MKRENYENDQLPLTKEDIIDELIDINYYLIEAIRNDDNPEIIKRKIMLDNLIKIYLR